MKVLKHVLDLPEFDVPFEVKMPDGCKVIDVQKQGNDFVMWYTCHGALKIKPRRFVWAATGYSELPDVCTHIKTLQEGVVVLHLFEVYK